MAYSLRVQGSGPGVQESCSLLRKSAVVLFSITRALWPRQRTGLGANIRSSFSRWLRFRMIGALSCLLYLVLGTVLLVATGCGRGTPPVEIFEKQWHEAIKSRQYDLLFEMLDASSRRHYRQELDRLRGLSDHAQQYVIERLGGEKVKTLCDLTPPFYFSRLWHRATDGQRPKMLIEAHSGTTAYMILWLDKSRKLRVQLRVEAGRWVWRMPPQDLAPSRIETGRIETPDLGLVAPGS